MKFRLEVDPGAEEELVLRVRELNAQALRLQKWASDLLVEKAEMKLYRGDTEYYVLFETILFLKAASTAQRCIRRCRYTQRSYACMNWNSYCHTLLYVVPRHAF